MIIDIDINDLSTVDNQGSVVRMTGTNAEDPSQRVTFAGDHRSMAGLLALVEDQGEVTAVVEDWQILNIRAVEACS